MTACAIPNCKRAVRCRGLCTTCYYRIKRRGEKLPPTKWLHRLSEIDPKLKQALCSTCGRTAIVGREGSTLRATAHAWRCKKAAWANTRRWKKAHRRARLGPKCEICGSTKKLCWDHNHITGKHRGTLCSACNVGIGFFQDDPRRLAKAISYLKKKS